MLLEEIEFHINQLAVRKVNEFQKYHNNLELIHNREKRKIKNPPQKEVKFPEEWSVDKKYNPFYVLKHKKQIAKSIFNKLINGTYEPFKPYLKIIPKKIVSKLDQYTYFRYQMKRYQITFIVDYLARINTDLVPSRMPIGMIEMFTMPSKILHLILKPHLGYSLLNLTSEIFSGQLTMITY